MASNPKQIYLATRKRNDQLFNAYFMRPLAAVLIALIQNTAATPNRLTLASVSIFTISAGLFMGLPDGTGLVAAIVALELSYLCDCADGMLARHRKIASQQGHLFDFFTDEVKAVMLVGAVGVRLSLIHI